MDATANSNTHAMDMEAKHPTARERSITQLTSHYTLTQVELHHRAERRDGHNSTATRRDATAHSPAHPLDA